MPIVANVSPADGPNGMKITRLTSDGRATAGTVTMHLVMSRAVAKKLGHLKHVTLTVHMSLVDAAGKHFSVDVAGNY